MARYAEPSDLPDGTEDPETLILLASAIINEATLTAIYPTNADGSPEDPELAALFRAVVVAQVAYWAALGVDPSKGEAGVNAEARVSTKAIGSASISYDFRGSEASATARLASLSELGPAAAALLAALPRGAVFVYG